MNALPEELLSQIVSHLVPAQPLLTCPETSTLYALCMTSRRLLRIARPCLYTCIRSTSSKKADQLLGVLEQSPTLTNRVQSLSVQHSDQTAARANETTTNDPHIKVEHTLLTIFTIRLLPHLTTLDLLQCLTREDRIPIWSFLFIHPDPKTPTPWAIHPKSTVTCLPHLRSLSLHLGHHPVHRITPYLRLPTLRTLELDMHLPPRDRNPQSPRYDIGTPVEHLRLIGCDVSREGDVQWLSDELVNVSSLFLATSEVRMGTPVVVGMFGREQLRRGSVLRMQVVSGEVGWCDVEFEAGVEDAEMYSAACVGVLLRAAGKGGGEEGKGVKGVAVRELTAEERVVYEGRFGFVWRPGGRSGGVEGVREGT